MKATSWRAALFVSAVAASTLAQEAPDSEKELPPIPEELREQVAFAEARGRELYAHDQAAWHATDAAKPGSRRWKKKLQGWITVPREEGKRPLVRFIEEATPGQWVSHVDVDVRLTTSELVPHDPPVALPEEQQELARARALAIKGRKRQCTKALNTVVLRDPSGEVHVYLLAASTSRREIVLLGHDLARVNSDGREILELRQFSNSCLITQRDEDAVGMFVSHVLSPAPTETHVFTALNYGITLYVVTDGGAWGTSAGEIRLVKEPE